MLIHDLDSYKFGYDLLRLDIINLDEILYHLIKIDIKRKTKIDKKRKGKNGSLVSL